MDRQTVLVIPTRLGARLAVECWSVIWRVIKQRTISRSLFFCGSRWIRASARRGKGNLQIRSLLPPGRGGRGGSAAALLCFFVFENIAGLAIQSFADRLHR